MSVYRDTTNEVQQEGFIKRLYRVESNKSSQNMKMDEMGRLKYQNSDIYTYFSATDRHHQYFLDKRFSSYLNDILKQNGLSINRNNILKQNGLSINRNNILDPKTYSVIKNLIIKNADLSLFLSMKLHTSSIVFRLLEANSCRIENKHVYSSRLPERSDPKRYSGGYGVCGQWLDLILNFTFFSEVHSYDTNDALDFLMQAKKNRSILDCGGCNSKKNMIY